MRSLNNSIGLTLLRLLVIAVFFGTGFRGLCAESTRPERRLIVEGNKLYKEKKFADAKQKFLLALKENENSSVARFNIALSNYRLAELSKDNDSIAQKLKGEAVHDFTKVAELGKSNPSLASKANYNIGNINFEMEDYASAIQYYKKALRLDPSFNEARRNLRIAQLKLPKNDNKSNQNNDKDKEKEKEQKQDQDNQDQQKQQPENNQQDKKDQKEQQHQNANELSEQAAEQILNAVENKEQTARQNINKQNEEKAGRNSHLKKW